MSETRLPLARDTSFLLEPDSNKFSWSFKNGFDRLTGMRFTVAALSAILALPFGGPSFAEDPALVQPLAERVFHVSARGAVGFAAVTAGLSVIDLSRPETPKILSLVPLPQSATFALSAGDVVWVTQGPAGVYAIDTKAPLKPAILGHIDTPGSAMMADLSGDVLAVADGSMGVAFFDVHRAREPSPRGNLDPGGYCRGVEFFSHRLYACAGDAGIGVYRFEPPASLELVHRVETPGTTQTR